MLVLKSRQSDVYTVVKLRSKSSWKLIAATYVH